MQDLDDDGHVGDPLSNSLGEDIFTGASANGIPIVDLVDDVFQGNSGLDIM